MTDTDYNHKLDELDRLLNDPDVAMEPARIWSLLAEISQREVPEPIAIAGDFGRVAAH